MRRLAVTGAVLLVLVAAALAGYLTRRDLARNALTGWLEERGVPAQVEVERFGPTGAVASIRAGSKDDPQFSVERAEIEYGLLGLWSGDPFGVEVKRVRLMRPVLRGALRDGRVTFGPLDKIIEEFRRRPPRPDQARPEILIEDGLVGLDTQYGLARFRGDARIADNKLMSLDGRLAPAAAKVGALTVALRGGEVQLRTRGDRIAFSVGALVEKAAGSGVELHESFLRVSGEGPYPDFEKRRGDGALSATLSGGARDLRWPGTALSGVEFNGRFNGRTTGWLETLALGGRGGFEAKAENARLGQAVVRKAVLDGEAPTLSWARPAPDKVSAQGRMSLRAGEVATGDLRLQDVIGQFHGDVSTGQGGALKLTGGLSSNGAWRGLGEAKAADDPGLAAVKRAARSFSLHAPALSVRSAGKGLTVAMGAPARLTAASGGEAVVSPRAGAPIFDGGRGAFLLRADGGGMPRVSLAVDRYTLRPGGFEAQGQGRLDGDLLLFRDAQLQLAGGLSLHNGAMVLTAKGCAPIRAGRLELGENDVRDFAAVACPTKAPLLTWKDDAWRVRTGLRDASADAKFLDVRFEGGAGDLDAGGSGGPITLAANVAQARVIDTAAETRFNPVVASGQADAAQGRWTAVFALATPSGQNLGRARLHHDDAARRGGFDIDTGDLAFAPEGLQPADLSPLARLVASPAQGSARLVAGFAWAGDKTSSSGRLAVNGLDFRGPIGPVHGLKGEVALTSLAPLATPPGQTLTAERIDAFAPLTDARASFSIADEALHLEAAQVTAGQGLVQLEPLTAPFDPKAEWGGVVRLTGVELSDIVEASPVADSLDLSAKVDGKAPFRITAQGIRIAGGELHAVEPGRISIKREALTQVSAEGGAPEAPPNMTVDFAYQAMENLAFQQLSAQIDSRPNGRLGVTFHIVGSHDPPKRQELRLSWIELLRQNFMERVHPLPSGVKVDLTLDMSLNFDQLLADWNEYQSLIDSRRRGSAKVQPNPGTTAPESSPGETP
ncbi:MAG: YdbH domain-containing protein [Phenylobacterium sp.]